MHPDLQWIAAVQRASARSAATVHGELKRGVDSLATIVSIAPFLGMFGTLVGIVNSFPGGSWEKTALMAAEAELLSLSIVPTAVSLFVAITAQCCYLYLSSQMETFDMEMQNASLDLVNQLVRYRRL